MLLFKIIYVLDAIVAIIFFYFFLVGIGDGTVSGFNVVAWIAIIVALAAILWGSLWLRSHNYTILAFLTLLILAIPSLLVGFYFLIAITGKGRMN